MGASVDAIIYAVGPHTHTVKYHNTHIYKYSSKLWETKEDGCVR